MRTRSVDYVIVGGGIAGMYCAIQLRKKEPACSLVVLEQSAHLGGRANAHFFGGRWVPTGAGIGRAQDVQLRKFIETELGMGTAPTWSRYVYLEAHLAPLRSQWQGLWRRIQQHAEAYAGMNFKSAATSILGIQKYNVFVKLSGYTDFEQAEVMDVVKWYSMQDNVPSIPSIPGINTHNKNVNYAFGVDWKALIDKCAERIGTDSIVLRCNVTEILSSGRVVSTCTSTSQTSPTTFVASKHIFVGVPLPSMLRLFPNHKPLLSIRSQPFIRVYAVLEKPIAGLNGFTVVSNELQKIIPMDASKTGTGTGTASGTSLVMIAYADNEAANACWDACKRKDTGWFERRLNDTFHLQSRDKVKIQRMWHKYWRAGTHYYVSRMNEWEMLDLVDVGMKIKLIGEAVSHKQGWTEGALDSVHKALFLTKVKYAK